MSHFSTLVILDNREAEENEDVESSVSELLRPFQEEADPEFMEFVDDEDEYKQKYENESREMVKLANGEIFYKFDERFKTSADFEFPRKYEYPKDSQILNVPHKEIYTTFDEFMADYCG